jgi:glucose/arabinose dehydrogenase
MPNDHTLILIYLQRQVTHYNHLYRLRGLPIFIIIALGFCSMTACALQSERDSAQVNSSTQVGGSTQIDGSWRLALTLGEWTDQARLELQESGNAVTGQYSGVLGMNKAVNGRYTDHQLSLSFEGEWPTSGSVLQVKILGDLTNDSGSGTFEVTNLGKGTWKANRLKPSEARITSTAVSADIRSQKPGASWKITAADLPKPGGPTFANAPKLITRPPDAWPQAPSGFKVELYASGFDYPRKMQTAPNGDVFLAESSLGEIKILRGITADGKAAMVAKFATGLKQPFGIAFYPPGPNPRFIYIANSGSVVRFPYINGDLTARAASHTIIPDLPAADGGWHWTRDLAFSSGGKRLYVSVGSLSNSDDPDTHPAEKRRASILEYTPEGQFVRIYASGIRNPVGIAIDPVTGRLWCSVNERDMMGDDLVPDYITHVEPGGFYGWPWYYIGSNQDPKHVGKHPELRDKVLVPDVLLPAHSASLTMTFYQGRQFPKVYRGDIFAAQHGSSNRSVRTGYEVIRVPLNGGRATGAYEDFLTGFVTADGRVWGRPVGVAVAQDGSLLVSDDGSKSVWRISYRGKE